MTRSIKLVTPREKTEHISAPDKAQSDPNQPNPFHECEVNQAEFLSRHDQHFSHVTPHHQRYLWGSVLTEPKDTIQNWKRTAFPDYEEDKKTQPRYIPATASNGKAATLPVGMHHDGAIVATLNRRIEALETRLKELECSGTTSPEETDSA